MMRLQKYMAQCGIASRRKAEMMIAEGRVSVNGKVVMVPGTNIDETRDKVSVDGKMIGISQYVYFLLNKPKGTICTVEDRHAEKIVTELLPQTDRLYPVGRLDKDTEGLIIMTNDGDLTYRLTHPSCGFTKTYVAKVKGRITDKALAQLRQGVMIDHDGQAYTTHPARVSVLQQRIGSTELQLTISEGKNRQIRKMCESVGFPVLELKRIALGKISAPDLKVGAWRVLSGEEVAYLKEFK